MCSEERDGNKGIDLSTSDFTPAMRIALEKIFREVFEALARL